jgi:hypothetical protein
MLCHFETTQTGTSSHCARLIPTQSCDTRMMRESLKCGSNREIWLSCDCVTCKISLFPVAYVNIARLGHKAFAVSIDGRNALRCHAGHSV